MKRTMLLFTGIILFAGCSDYVTGARAIRDLQTLKRVTGPFRSFQVASDAGWSAKITACMTQPDSGGMGFHYGNVDLIDSTVRVDEPEVLLYEPKEGGKLELVAVEYIIPYDLHPRDAEPPVLFGQQFTQNDTFQLWGLHVWVWKDNPSGLYANWNPNVNCDHTTDVATMVHH
jgi:hypothetical protein